MRIILFAISLCVLWSGLGAAAPAPALTAVAPTTRDTAPATSKQPQSPPPLVPLPPRPEYNAAIITSACLVAADKLAADKLAADRLAVEKPGANKLAAADKGVTTAECKSMNFCDPAKTLLASLLTRKQISQLNNGQCPDAPPESDKGDQGSVAVQGASAVGVSWQETVLNGVAAFLVERAKAEAVASLAQLVKDSICTAQDATLMPATCALLVPTPSKAADDPKNPSASSSRNASPATATEAKGAAQTPIAWGTLKAAFELDLPGLAERLIRSRIPGDRGEPLITLLEGVQMLAAGDDPFEILLGLRVKYAAIDSADKCKESPSSCALEVLGRAVEVLTPNPESARRSEPRYQTLYAAVAARLLLEVTKPVIDQSTKQSAQDIMAQLAPAIARLWQTASNAQTAMNAVLSGGQSTDMAVVRTALSNDARAFASAIELAYAVMPNTARPPTLAPAIEHLIASIDHAHNAEYNAGFVELLAALNAAEIAPPAWFANYGSFVAEVASAKTSADVQHALEAAAAPIGSWHAKRGTGHHALTVNGYLGAQGGYEWLGADRVPTARSLQGGLFAPIGLEASWGFRRAWSGGILMSALDLGALVDYRSDSAQGTAKIDQSSQIGFRQVFSPGVFGVLGLGFGDQGVPVVLGGGVSLSPELRSVDLVDGSSVRASALRFNVFLAIDVTIFGL